MLKKILFVAVLFLLVACSDENQVSQSSQPQKQVPAEVNQLVASDANHYLVFFINPAGAPCRQQNAILQSMAGELNGKVNVRYMQTTVQEDLQYFYSYGIRGLPSLLLADANGNEIKRLAPGVNPPEAVRDLLRAIPN